jgi:hypothetical protein
VFKQVLVAQWQTSKLAVGLLTLLSFCIPLLAVLYGGDLAGAGRERVGDWLIAADRVAQFPPFIALLVGLLLGTLAWSADLAGRHVYALSLPLPRGLYVSMRFGAGALFATIPGAAMGLSSGIATLAVSLPPGIHAYPVEMALRFWLASLTVFAIIFAIAGGTRRGQVITISVIGAAITLDVVFLLFGVDYSVTAEALLLLTNWPGPLSLLTGRWALFDV